MKKHIALGLVASTLFLAGCCTSHHSTAWEYREIYPLSQNRVTELDAAGKDGWILVTTVDNDRGFILKRAKQP